MTNRDLKIFLSIFAGKIEIKSIKWNRDTININSGLKTNLKLKFNFNEHRYTIKA
jgi:hypothetical protein